ncbi:MAG TPA: MFS transporter [Acidimicrobiales bacterium]|nr:MFS transporter [Acidimicrobiales bacterium]
MPGDPAVPGEPDAGPRPRPPFLLIVSVTLTGIMGSVLISPVTPDIVEEFRTGPTGVGLLVGAHSGPGILLAPLIGVMADRFGRRRVLVPCLLLFGLGGGLASFAPSFPVLVLLRVVQGAGSAGLINLAVVLIGDHWSGAERVRMMGRNAATLTASLAVLPPLGGLLGSLGGWRLSFVPYWLGGVTALAVLRYLPPSPPGHGSLADQVRRARPYLRDRVVLGSLWMAFVLFLVIFGSFLTVVPVRLKEDFGLSSGPRGLVLAGPAVTATLTSLNLTWLRRRFGAVPLVAGGSVLVAAGLAVLGAAPSLPLLMVGPVIYGIGEGMMVPTIQELVASTPPATSRGAVVAVFVAVTRLGQTVGPLTAGSALEQVEPSTVLLGGAAVALMAAGTAPLLRSPAAAR